MAASRRHLGLVLALSCAMSACALPTVKKGTGGTQQEGTIKGSIKGTTVKAPSPRPGTTPTPSAAPSTKASTQPAASPLPSPPSLSAESKRIQAAVEGKLLAIARAGFSQNRSSLLSNNGGGILSDNGLGVIANNGVGIISNNSGGIISDNGLGYHVAQAATPTINTSPLADELQYIDRLWPGDLHQLTFIKRTSTATNTYVRNVYISPDGKPFEEDTSTALVSALGLPTHTEDDSLFLWPDGQLAYSTAMVREWDDTLGLLKKFSTRQGAIKAREPKSGAAIDIDELTLDADAGTGTFRYNFVSLGLVETGSLVNVKRDPGGNLKFSPFDPLAYFDGESKVEDDKGALIYNKKQVTANGATTLTYDLGANMVAVLNKQTNTYKGVLNENGNPVAKLEQTRRIDGSVVFSIFFPEQPTAPVVLGYGVKAFDVAPDPDAPPNDWRVITLAGAANAGFGGGASFAVPGYVDGPGDKARFGELGMIVQSRKQPNMYFLADTGNHRIRTLTLNGITATVGTYAGDGTAGETNGPKASARFNRPLGLAIAADDTLYVSDGHHIRKIAAGGTVSTLAGSATAGFADGAADQARFDTPAGLALGSDGSVLFVADSKNHRVRQVDTATGAVTTILGDGTAKDTDGPTASAQLNGPRALAVDGAGTLYVGTASMRVHKVTGGQMTLYGGGGTTAKAFTDGPATGGALLSLGSLTLGADGTLYLGGWDIRKIGTDGRIGGVAGIGSAASYGDAEVPESGFSNVLGIAFADRGAMLMTDGTAVRMIVPPTPKP